MDIFLLTKIVTTLVALGGGVYAIWTRVIKPVIDWLKRMAGLLETVEKELKPNGGSSLRDAINRIELRQIIADEKAQAMEMDSIKGVWEADTKGRYIHTNRTYQKITGLSSEATHGYGWLNAIHKDDREGVLKDWEQAVSQQREFYQTFRIQVGKKVVRVVCVGYPLKFSGVTHKYAGILVEESEEDTVFFENERV